VKWRALQTQLVRAAKTVRCKHFESAYTAADSDLTGLLLQLFDVQQVGAVVRRDGPVVVLA
jgi:hypothetical protein